MPLDVALSTTPPHTSAPLSSEQADFFQDQGYLILEGFFDAERVAQFKAHVDTLWAGRAGGPLVIDAYGDYLGGGQMERAYFAGVNERSRAFPYKLNDSHLIDPIVQGFSLDPRLTAILGQLLDATPLACNSLLFERGSEQQAHFDTFFMPSPTPNKMAATWIAFDPVTEANGPLFYYPGSHLIEPYRFANGGIAANGAEMPDATRHIERIIAEYGLEEKKFYPRPGDVLIWHAQLLHGGFPIHDLSPTRTALVTHYWTTLDYSDPAEHIALEAGQLILNKAHQSVANATTRAVDAFVEGLNTPPEHRAAVPETFEPGRYLLANLDVFFAGADPYSHYVNHGRDEGRTW